MVEFPERFSSKTDNAKKNAMTNRDYNINYRVEGPKDGPPILLVHGFGANVNHFRFQFPTLVAEGYRVYAVDLLERLQDGFAEILGSATHFVITGQTSISATTDFSRSRRGRSNTATNMAKNCPTKAIVA